MYHITGFTKAEITRLCAGIEAREFSPRVRRWPPVLGLRNAVTVTSTYLRGNRVHAEIAEHYGVWQPAISRAVSAITPLRHRAGHCELQNLADHAHPLPPTPSNIPRNHLSRSRHALLRSRLNNPQCPTMLIAGSGRGSRVRTVRARSTGTLRSAPCNRTPPVVHADVPGGAAWESTR